MITDYFLHVPFFAKCITDSVSYIDKYIFVCYT